MTDTLVIEGDIHRAMTHDVGRQKIASIRRSLVTGGRALLAGAGGTRRIQIDMGDLMPVTIYLAPLIARRIYTSGAQLTEEEISDGLAQLRESNEDVELRQITETVDAIEAGVRYADQQWGLAINTGDERALHQAWEMARKVNGLRKRLDALHRG